MKILFVAIFAFLVPCIIPDAESWHTGTGEVPCQITINTRIIPVYFADVHSPRNNPDGTYYPGDALHFLFHYDASPTCRNFAIHPLKSSGGITVTQHHGTLHMHGSPILGYSDHDSIHNGPQPEISPHPYESKKGTLHFANRVEGVCDKTKDANPHSGCVFGHAEISEDQKLLDQTHCKTVLDRDDNEKRVCQDIANKLTLKISGQKKICKVIKNDLVCYWVTVTKLADISPKILDPNITMTLKIKNLTDSDGYTIRNLDGTFYPWDAINLVHQPFYKWQNQRAGTLKTQTIKENVLTKEYEFDCITKKPPGTCSYTLDFQRHRISPWHQEFDQGAGHTIYNATSENDLGIRQFHYKINLLNTGRLLNSTSDSYQVLVVKYSPLYESHPYNVLSDGHWWAYGNRQAVALKYLGSTGGGPDDPPQDKVHKHRRSKINEFEFSGFGFDPVNKVVLNETMTWSKASPIQVEPNQTQDSCIRVVQFAPSFQANDNHTAMFVQAGYGKIFFSYPILRTALEQRYHEITVQNTLQSGHFGGFDILNLTSYDYVYPRTKFHTSVKVIAKNSNGTIDKLPLHIDMTPKIHLGAEYTQDYVCKKTIHDTKDDHFAAILLDDMYQKSNQKSSTNGIINLKAGLTSTWFPNYTEPFLASSNYAVWNKANLETENTTNGTVYKEIMDIPINFGFAALSPYDITITANTTNNTQIQRTLDVQTFQFYSNHVFVVNLDQDNNLNATVHKENQTDTILATIHYNPDFGQIESLYVDDTKHTRNCKTGCTIQLDDPDTANIIAYNLWGGKATANISYNYTMPEPTKHRSATDDVFWVMLFAAIASFVVCKEYKRVINYILK